MKITLNIGLEVSKHYLPEGAASMELQYKYVKDLLEEEFGKPLCIGLAKSTTEETIVVQYQEPHYVLYRLHSLAHELKQDCIAYTIHDADGVMRGGALVGEYAHEWNYGVFNEDYFIAHTA